MPLPEGTNDADVLAWAAAEHRVLITNDRNTMIAAALARAKSGEFVKGIIVTSNRQSIGSTIEDLLLLAECLSEQEMADHMIIYLPLR